MSRPWTLLLRDSWDVAVATLRGVAVTTLQPSLLHCELSERGGHEEGGVPGVGRGSEGVAGVG